MKRINVLHIVATGKLSGAEKVVSDICTNLDDEFKPFAVCAGQELKNYYLEKGIESYIIDISKLNLNEILKLKRLIKSKDIDIVHGHDIKASIAGYLASRGAKIPVISHMHASYFWMTRPTPLKIIDRYFRSKYDLSISVSEMAKSYYLEHNKAVDSERILTLNNAFNFNEFNKLKIQDKNDFKRSIGIPQDKFVYGFLGRLLDIKGVDLLIDSFNDLQKDKKDAVLLIVGDGPEREALKERTLKYGIDGKVIFTGYQKNVYDYINIFDCFILPSVTEGLPISVLEAMAMHKVVISTPVAGLKDLMKNGYNGIVIEKRDKDNLLMAMSKVYKNQELIEEIGSNAYNYLYENYNINSYIKKLEDIYMKVIKKA